MKIKFGKFKSCVTDLPTKDGEYLVLGFLRGELFTGSSMSFTVEHGWNTNANSDKHRIDYGDNGHKDFEYFWTDVVTKGEK